MRNGVPIYRDAESPKQIPHGNMNKQPLLGSVSIFSIQPSSWKRGLETQSTVEKSRKYIVQNLKVLIDANCLPVMRQMKTNSRIICGPLESAQNGQ